MKIKMKHLSLAMLPSCLGVLLAAAANNAGAQQTQKIEKIEVTGSSIKRIEGETALPVQVISKEEIARSGVVTASELLERVSANAFGYNVSQGVGDSGQPGFAGVNLRGLGSSSTLVLLNGRRVANYAFNGGAVDVNSIPLSAVERVEVLKDGASAIYGTDAIGGVVNFILKKDYQGVDGSYYKTHNYQGGGNVEKYTLSGGFGNLDTQKFNILVAFDKEKSDALAARQRDFARTGIRPDLGFTKTSGNAIPANFTWAGGPGNVNSSAYGGCVPSVGSYQINTATGQPQPTRNNCRYDYTAGLDIFPPSDKKSAVARGTLQLGADHQLFGEYTYVNTKFTFASSETPVNNFSGNGPFIYPAGGKYYPGPFILPSTGATVTPTGNLTIAWRLKDGGPRTDQSNADATRYVVGLKGLLVGWDYETAYSKAESKVTDNYVNGWVSEAKLRAAIATGNINVFNTTGQDATGQALINAAKILGPVRISKGTTESIDGKISKEIFQMPAGAAAAAFGFESRKEKLSDNPQPVLFSGDILGGGGALPPVTADRRVNAVFTEVNVPLTKTLEGTAAVRYDKYSDFGNTTNPKFGFRWTPAKEVLVRGSYNTGFRAPTLPDLALPNFLSNTANSFNDPLRCPNGVPIGPYVNSSLECDAQFQSQQGGNKKLQPEKSKQWTLGVVFEPSNQTSVGVDFWNIDKRNTIGTISDSVLFGNYAQYSAQGFFPRACNNISGTPTPAGVPCEISYVVQTQQNLGKTETNGFDISGQYRFPKSDLGNFKFAYDGTYVNKYSSQRVKDGVFFSGVGRYDNGAVIVRYRATQALDWNDGVWNGRIAYNYTAGYRDYSDTRDVEPFETWDTQLSWTGIKHLTLTAGVRNLLDRAPPTSNQGDTFQVGYDPRYADPRGRAYYGRVSFSFK